MEEVLLDIQIKTLNNKIFDFSLPKNITILELKNNIMERMEVPICKQRIVYKGKLMQNNKTLESYNIQSGQILHLIAKVEERLATNTSSQSSKEKIPETMRRGIYINPDQNTSTTQNLNPIYERSPSRASSHDSETDEMQQNEVIAGILRTLRDSSMNRPNYRRRLMQQRILGFNVSAQESTEVLRQNLITLSQLSQSMCSVENVSGVHGITPFNYNRRTLTIGQWVDVKDTVNQWCEAQIMNTRKILDAQSSLEKDQVLVHYSGWASSWDE